MTEYLIQSSIVKWFRHTYPNVLIYHTPNGGKRDPKEAAVLKNLGVIAGIPDLFIPSLKLYVEVKSKVGKLSNEQLEIMCELEKSGYICKTVHSLEAFKKLFE